MNELRLLCSPPLPERKSHCPPATTLEWVAAGEPASSATAQHLTECPTCQSYVAALRAGREDFVRGQPPELFMRKLEMRANRPSRLRPRMLALAASGTLAAAAILYVAMPVNQIRVKGGSLKVVYRRGESGEPKSVTPEMRLRAGDALRFSFLAHPQGYIAVLDVDGTGKVTPFYPFGGVRAAPIAPGDPNWLPGSVILDAAPGPDWLICVFDTKPFELAPLVAELTALAPGRVPDVHCGSCRVELLRIHKEP